MGNILLKAGKKALITGGKLVAEQLAPDVVNLAAKVGNEYYEKQKNLIRIPDLKDIHIEEALRVLKEDLGLNPISAIANPSVGFADESINEVMYTEPKFGTKIDPKSTVKVYYLTSEVIEKSKELLSTKIQTFNIPRVIGLNIYDAREDLENLGLKVDMKVEKPRVEFSNYEFGQVTQLTYPNNKKINSKLSTRERVWLYYVTEEVVTESQTLKDFRENENRQRIDKLGQTTANVSKDLINGIVDTTSNVGKLIGSQFNKTKK